MVDHSSEIDKELKLLESINKVKDIDETIKILNTRLRNMVQEINAGERVSSVTYVGELEVISKNIQALTDYRACLWKIK